MKKNLFFVLVSLTLIIGMFTACNPSEQQIRDAIQKEYEEQIQQVLKSPKNILSYEETDLVMKEFTKKKIDLGETPICKLRDGREISFNIDSEKGYKFLISYDNKKEEALMPAAVPIAAGSLVNNYVSVVVKDWPSWPKKYWELECTEIHRYDPSSWSNCFQKCGHTDSGGYEACVAACKDVQSSSTTMKICWWVHKNK